MTKKSKTKVPAQRRTEQKLPALPEEYRGITANLGLYALLKHCEFSSVLDIGSGAGAHAHIMESSGKQVTRFDFGKSRAFDAEQELDKTIIGDYIKYSFKQKYDCIWASHVLEHTLYTQEFLEKMVRGCKEGGYIAVTVPPAKSELVGGHVTLWTTGLLLYRMILAGIDCCKAQCLRYGYNITVITKNLGNNLDLENLAWDFHDLERLQAFFPPEVYPQINGDLIGRVFQGAQINLTK